LQQELDWHLAPGEENCRCQNQFGMDDRDEWRLNFKMKIKRKECDNLKSTALVGLEKVFFDVPVYRLSKEEYESQQKDFIQKELKQCGGKYAEEAYRRYPELKSKTESDLWENYGGCWLFNEIIGFIRLYFFFSEIRGEYWHTSAQKIVRTRRKVFYPKGNDFGFGECIPHGSSNVEIYKHIGMFLDRVQMGKEFKRRYVDKSVLENIGKHINWNKLIEEQFVREQSEPCQPIETN
jgi:hypothetical protein